MTPSYLPFLYALLVAHHEISANTQREHIRPAASFHPHTRSVERIWVLLQMVTHSRAPNGKQIEKQLTHTQHESMHHLVKK